MSVRRVLVVNQYYAPDVAATGQLAAEICAALVAEGFEVTVVAGQPSYADGQSPAPEHEILNGVQVHRVPMGAAKGRERLRHRLLGYARFMLEANRRAMRLCAAEKYDCVLTFHNPPLVGTLGIRLARRLRCPYVYVLHDIHPDILLATGWLRLPRPAVWMWERINAKVYRQAARIVVLGEGMRETLILKGVHPDKLRVIPLWGRPEIGAAPNTALQPSANGRDLKLLYAGNLGIMHDVEPILDAANGLRGEPVRFLFVGDGARKADMVARTKARGLTNVEFLPFQSEPQFVQMIRSADACLVALQPGSEGLAVPSRAFTFLSAGKPLLNLMASTADVARLTDKAQCGWSFQTGSELEALVRRIAGDREELQGAACRAQQLYQDEFRREKIIGDYARLLREL